MEYKPYKYLYVCDQKPGACSGFEKEHWKHCQNPFCFSTSNVAHAINCVDGHIQPGQKFVEIEAEDKILVFEFTDFCPHKNKCDAKLEHDGKAYCIDGKCPL